MPQLQRSMKVIDMDTGEVVYMFEDRATCINRLRRKNRLKCYFKDFDRDKK